MPSSTSYHITEPHPSVPRSSYIRSGRGGAGNFSLVDPKKISAPRTASGPASATKLTPPPPNSLFMSGRGGAGNVHHEYERAIFSFDEELALERKMMENQGRTPVYHIGRGGAGNLVDDMRPRGSRAAGSSSSSVVSGGSGASGASGKARRSIEGAWERVRQSFSQQ